MPIKSTRQENRRWLERTVKNKASRLDATQAEINHALDVACNYMDSYSCSSGNTCGQMADVGIQAIRTRRNRP